MDKKWNLQDIKPPKRPSRITRTSVPMDEPVERVAPAREPAAPRMRASNTRSGKKHIWVALLIFISLAALGVMIGTFIGGAKVTVFPRWREPVINTPLEAKRQATGNELAYEIITFEAEGERQVAATGQEQVTEQATGEITIYKTTPGQERLIKNTRFESSDGHIFRITESAVVPGATTDSEGKSVPGSVTAKIFAEEAGPEYNLAAGTRFSVPGFRESDLTDLYNAIYAENASAITGGFDGPRYIVDDAEMQSALSSLRSELKEALQQRVNNEKPAGFTVLPSSYTYTYTTLPGEAVGEGQVKVKEKVALKVPLFKDDALASFIAKSVVPGYDNEPVRIENAVESLSFEYIDPTTVESDLAAKESISFRLSGKPRLIWVYDAEQLKKDLAGASKTAINTVLGGYPAIEKATATIRPFWARSFPTDPADITIIESVGQ